MSAKKSSYFPFRDVMYTERIRSNLTGTVSYKFEFYQVKEALLDVRLYMVALLVFCSGVPNGGRRPYHRLHPIRVSG